MTPVMQTRFGVRGNCLSACVASLLGVSLAAVDFSCVDYPEGRWCDALGALIKPFGYVHVFVADRSSDVEALHIAHGLRHCCDSDDAIAMTHACVYRDGKLIHDPHPNSLGLERVTSISLLVPFTLYMQPVGRTAAHVVSQVRKLEIWAQARRGLCMDVGSLPRSIEYLREYAALLGYDWSKET